jgi:hypothetical protein
MALEFRALAAEFPIAAGDRSSSRDHDLIITVGESIGTPEEETGITVQVDIGASRTGCTALVLVDKESTRRSFYSNASRPS